MPVHASSRFSRRAHLAGLLLLAGLLASCSSDDPAPIEPGPDPDPAPSPMFTVVGEPRLAVRFNGLMSESLADTALGGNFSVTLTDSLSRRQFLPDVRLNGVPMVQEVDAFGSPSRYTLDASMLPDLSMADTLRFEALDGGVFSPPFKFLITPSHITTLPADSTVFDGQDIKLKWTGAVERVLITLTDNTGKRLRFNLQVENYTGLNSMIIPWRDFVLLYPGDIVVGTDVLDQEVRLPTGLSLQSVTMETRQSRLWRLSPTLP